MEELKSRFHVFSDSVVLVNVDKHSTYHILFDRLRDCVVYEDHKLGPQLMFRFLDDAKTPLAIGGRKEVLYSLWEGVTRAFVEYKQRKEPEEDKLQPTTKRSRE